jgi:hypothetical protein
MKNIRRFRKEKSPYPDAFGLPFQRLFPRQGELNVQ